MGDTPEEVKRPGGEVPPGEGQGSERGVFGLFGVLIGGQVSPPVFEQGLDRVDVFAGLAVAVDVALAGAALILPVAAAVHRVGVALRVRPLRGLGQQEGPAVPLDRHLDHEVLGGGAGREDLQKAGPGLAAGNPVDGVVLAGLLGRQDFGEGRGR